MVAQSTRDNLEQLHRNVNFFFILLHEKLCMSRISRLNPKGVPNSLDISPSWTPTTIGISQAIVVLSITSRDKRNIICISQDDLTKLSIWKEGEYP
jgi:hypothetical protein